MGPQHLVPPLSLLLRLIHEGILVTSRVQLCQKLSIDEVFHIIDHEMHDSLWHQVTDAFVYNRHVGVH